MKRVDTLCLVSGFGVSGSVNARARNGISPVAGFMFGRLEAGERDAGREVFSASIRDPWPIHPRCGRYQHCDRTGKFLGNFMAYYSLFDLYVLSVSPLNRVSFSSTIVTSRPPASPPSYR